MPSPIAPAPRDAWRSRFEPSADLGVVDVEALEPIQADAAVELAERRVQGDLVGDVDTGHPPVARVQADPEARMPVEAVEDRRELVDRPADRAARAGRVLEHEPEPVVGQLE